MRPLADDEPVTIGPYRLLGRLGAGGMGRVYLGRSAGGRTVAVKIVHPHFALDEEFRARFRREVEAARRVGGAWTAPVLDADPDAPVPWVATAYAAGPSLASAVTGTGPLPEHTVRALAAGLAEALAAVHALGLVHRDVKPSNVLLTLDGPLLIDFGIARATDGTASLTATGASVGSPGYMAPEQILGKSATGAADVFSLGAVLTYAATGESPFPGNSSAALLYKVVHEEPELGALGGELRAVAEACLAKDPSARPAPAEVSRRLAPDGAARSIAGGWLPGPLVEQVSRSAVQLLNLDTAETVHSGPVAFDGPSVEGTGVGPIPSPSPIPAPAPAPAQSPIPGAGAGAGAVPGEGPGWDADAVTGEFGPAPVMGPAPSTPARRLPPASGFPAVPTAGSGSPAEPASASGFPAASGSGSGFPAPPAPASGFPVPPAHVPGFPAPPAHAPAPPGTPTVVPAPRDGDGARPGKLSVSVAASASPPDTGGGRRISCTVALAVAGALAVATVGVGALLRPWSGGHTSEAGGAPNPAASSATPGATPPGDSAPQPSGTSTDPPQGGSAGGGTKGPGAIPARYLGTWEGQATALDGGRHLGTYRLTVHQAAVGAELGRLRRTDQRGRVCTDVLTLRRATASRLTATSAGHDGCDPATHVVELTPTYGDLTYTSDSETQGNPVAVLTKAG
nr:serine/threonine-protein kinase [Streptomyces hygroscopicus]